MRNMRRVLYAVIRTSALSWPPSAARSHPARQKPSCGSIDESDVGEQLDPYEDSLMCGGCTLGPVRALRLRSGTWSGTKQASRRMVTLDVWRGVAMGSIAQFEQAA